MKYSNIRSGTCDFKGRLHLWCVWNGDSRCSRFECRYCPADRQLSMYSDSSPKGYWRLLRPQGLMWEPRQTELRCQTWATLLHRSPQHSGLYPICYTPPCSSLLLPVWILSPRESETAPQCELKGLSIGRTCEPAEKQANIFVITGVFVRFLDVSPIDLVCHYWSHYIEHLVQVLFFS